MSDAVRGMCEGVVPLPARLEPWQEDLLGRPDALDGLLERYGSPLNVIAPGRMAANLAELEDAAAARGVRFRAFFARKANKALSLVRQALELGAGVDVAGLDELSQSLGQGARAEDLVVTAAIKSRALVELCLSSGATCVIDNEDELELALDVAAGAGATLPVAFRLAVSGAAPGRPPTRFGMPAAAIAALVAREWGDGGRLRLEGIHFHVDGYAPGDRVRGLRESLALADQLEAGGRRLRWIDMGGGVPMNYLADPAGWDRFWEAHRAALAGERDPLTYLGHGLGLRAEADGTIAGEPAVYPAAQEVVRGVWLDRVLGAAAEEGGGGTIAEALDRRDVELRCEPGRSLLDGCGMTVARVAFRKRGAAGDGLVGVAMNRTQMRSTADDFLVDPLLVRPAAAGPPSEEGEAHLVGAYCIERELLTPRRMRFPAGVAVGDLIAFPNTAGYFMHILESSSHQMPLASNLIVRDGEPAGLDPIDTGSAGAGPP